MTTNGILAVDESNADVAGAISYWRLEGATDLQALTDAWVAAGLPRKQLPQPVSEKTALGRAFRTLSRRIDDTRQWNTFRAPSGHWVLLEIAADPQGNVTTTQIGKARHTVKDGIQIEADPFVSRTLHAAISAEQQALATTDVSGWLVDLAEKHSGVSMRDSGGVYFVPRHHMDFWRRAASVVESLAGCNHRVFRIPALRSAEAVEAILEAVVTEANRVAATLLADLTSEDTDNTPGDRGLATRAVQASAMLDKITSYEKLTGRALPQIMSKMQAVADAIARVRVGLPATESNLQAAVAIASLS